MGRAQTKRAVTHGLRYSVDDIIAQRRNEGDQHDAHDQPCRQNRCGPAHPVDPQQSVLATPKDFDQKRTYRQQGKQTVNDCRDTREDFQQRFGKGAYFVVSVFRQVDRSEEADRHGHQQRDDRDIERPPEQRQDRQVTVPAEVRGPCGAQKEILPRV